MAAQRECVPQVRLQITDHVRIAILLRLRFTDETAMGMTPTRDTWRPRLLGAQITSFARRPLLILFLAIAAGRVRLNALSASCRDCLPLRAGAAVARASAPDADLDPRLLVRSGRSTVSIVNGGSAVLPALAARYLRMPRVLGS